MNITPIKANIRFPIDVVIFITLRLEVAVLGVGISLCNPGRLLSGFAVG